MVLGNSQQITYPIYSFFFAHSALREWSFIPINSHARALIEQKINRILGRLFITSSLSWRYAVTCPQFISPQLKCERVSRLTAVCGLINCGLYLWKNIFEYQIKCSA